MWGAVAGAEIPIQTWRRKSWGYKIWEYLESKTQGLQNTKNNKYVS